MKCKINELSNITMKKIKLLTALAVIVAGGYLMHGQENKVATPLALQNVEALANNEHEINYFCYGSGSVKCPNGRDVEYYLDNLKLD